MQPPSSSSLRPPPLSSSSSFRPPLPFLAARPSFGSDMAAFRQPGEHSSVVQHGNQSFGNHEEGNMAGNSSSFAAQQFGNQREGNMAGHDPSLAAQDSDHSHGYLADGGNLNRSSDLEIKHSMQSDSPAKVTKHSMQSEPPLMQISNMESLAAQVAELKDQLAKAIAQRQSHTRSKSRGKSRSQSHVGRSNPRREEPVRSPLRERTRTWSKVVGDDEGSTLKKMSLQYYPPVFSADGVSVNPPIEVAREGTARWQRTLVGYFIEGRPSFTIVKEQVTKLWGAKGLTDVMANDRGFFFFTFATAADGANVLEAGPWIFQRQPLFLQPWRPGMRLFRETHDTVPLWVKLYNVPLEYWSEKGFSYLGSAVGVPLFPDSMTMSGRCVSFMRICVEVNASRPLLDNFELVLPPNEDGSPNSTTIRVEYPWKPKICHHCHVFGHTESNCFKLRKTKEQPTTQPNTLSAEGGNIGNTSSSHDDHIENGAKPSAPIQPHEPPSIPNEQSDHSKGNVEVVQQNVQGDSDSSPGVIVLSQPEPIPTSPNKFSYLEGDDDGLSDSPLGPLASKIQHIDGEFASARKKKNKAKATGGSQAKVGQNAQSRKFLK